MDKEEYNFNKKYKRNVKVFVQIKPSIESCWDNVKILDDRKSIYVRYPQDFSKGNLTKEKKFWHFYTNGILYNIHPFEIYQIVTEGLLESALEGNNVLIIAYGQTGCGKSTTINGFQNSYENRGISLRLIADLHKLKKKKQNELDIKLHMSCVEVRKTHLIDLAADDENVKIYMPYKDITKIKLESVNDGLNIVFKAEMKRAYAFNSVYDSHIYPSILTIHVESLSLVKSNPVNKYSKIHIVDMAGADTDGNSSCLHKNIPEIGSANLIKSQIEQILLFYNKHHTENKVLLRGKGRFVEYLSDSLRPECIIRFIAHINVDKKYAHVTLSHLRFGLIALCAAPAKLKPLVKTSTQLEMENLKDKLNYYINQNYLDSMIMNKDLSNFLPKARAEQVQKMVDDFISENVSDLALFNVSDAQMTLKILKQTYDKEIRDLKSNLNEKEEELDNLKVQLTKGSLSNKFDTKEPSTSERTAKKKRSSEKRSSHIIKENIPKKPSRVGSIENHGKSLGKRHSVKKGNSSIRVSQLRSKSGRSHSTRSSIKYKSGSATNASKESDPDIENLLMTDIKNYEDLWHLFLCEESFERLYTTLKNVFTDYKRILDSYTRCINKIESISKSREEKQAYQTKVLFFKDNKNFDCCVDETQKLVNTEKSLKENIECLTFNLNYFKENLLSYQAEIKILASQIRHIKKDICNTFIKFCVENYGSSFGDGSYYIDEMILNEDTTKVCESKEPTNEIEENFIMNTYYELQHEMAKKMENKKNVKKTC